MNQYDKAEHVFLRILRLEPDNAEAMTGLSMVLSRQAKYQQVCIVKSFNFREPDNVEAMTGLSMVLSRQAKYQQVCMV